MEKNHRHHGNYEEQYRFVEGDFGIERASPLLARIELLVGANQPEHQ
jgi:hypothetical protein